MNKEHGQKIINSNNYRVLVQVAFWIVILGTMSLLVLGFDAPRDFYFRNILQIISALIIVLINSLLLLPHFFARKKYKQYFLWITMAIILLTCINVINESKFLDLQPPDAKIEMKDRPKHGLIDIKYLINFLLLAGVAMAGIMVESLYQFNRQEKLVAEAETEKLETELKFLKNQINPHFLLNVLNNVFTLSLIKSEQTPEIILKLSELLRYMLYESSQKKVSLGKEIKYIENYIELFKLKFESELNIRLKIDDNYHEKMIAPLILIPFVENSCKHSDLDRNDGGWIYAEIKIIDDKLLVFHLSNSVSAVEYTKDRTGGIGLENVRRRLELEYPDRHTLNIHKTDTKFEVTLQIDLSQ